MAKRKAIPIKLEDPPPSMRGKARGGALAEFVQRLSDEYPNQWALLGRRRKNLGYLYSLRKRYPNLEVTTRKNSDDTHGVWMRVNTTSEKIASK